MRAIYKYALDGPTAAVVMPAAAQLLSAGVQDGQIVVWADVDTEARNAYRRIFCTNTGMPTPDGDHFATVVDPSGVVWHVFDQGQSWAP